MYNLLLEYIKIKFFLNTYPRVVVCKLFFLLKVLHTVNSLQQERKKKEEKYFQQIRFAKIWLDNLFLRKCSFCCCFFFNSSKGKQFRIYSSSIYANLILHRMKDGVFIWRPKFFFYHFFEIFRLKFLLKHQQSEKNPLLSFTMTTDWLILTASVIHFNKL